MYLLLGDIMGWRLLRIGPVSKVYRGKKEYLLDWAGGNATPIVKCRYGWQAQSRRIEL